jgi:uncharacterized protein (DUF2236 family)
MVNREMALLLGGGRALLMQLAHPAVAAAVDEHSDFRERPLQRLQRTLGLSFQLAFGTRAQAEAAARRINSRHRSVRGQGYQALDPDLLLWVHATLVDSSLAVYSTFVRRLSREEMAAYQRESLVTARLLGVPSDRLPAGLDQFEEYMRHMIEAELSVDERARRLARRVLAPPVRWLPAQAGFPLSAITAGLLPEQLRRAYNLAWGRSERLAFATAKRLLPAVLPALPSVLREVPAARRGKALRNP